MPRILRIINRLNLGGPTYNVSFLSRFLEPEFETMLLSGAIDETEESSEFILNKYNIKPVYINEMKRDIDLKSDRKAYLKIKEIIRDFKPDIVHTHMAKPGTVGRLAAIHCKIPVILHTFHGHYFHSYFDPVRTRLFLEIERYLARKSCGIVVLSDIQKHELSQIYKVTNPEKAFVIPLGFDLQKFTENQEQKRMQFRNEYGLSGDEIAVGIIGRLVPVKNHRLFIEAMKVVFENTSKNVRALIIGDGEDREKIVQMCIHAGLSFSLANQKQPSLDKQVIFTSWIKDIDYALAGLDIVALTSVNEGTPVSLIEAQAASKPIVTTKVGGIENIVLPGETALLCDSNNAGEFAENLITLINDDSLRAAMSCKGWIHVKDKFHYTRLVEDMRQLYHKLLNQAK